MKHAHWLIVFCALAAVLGCTSDNITSCNATDYCNTDNAFGPASCQARHPVGGQCWSLGMGNRCLSGHCQIDPTKPADPRRGAQGSCIAGPAVGSNCTAMKNCSFSTQWCDYDNAFAQSTCQPRQPLGSPCYSIGMGDRCLSGQCRIDPTKPPHPRLGMQGTCVAYPDGGWVGD